MRAMRATTVLFALGLGTLACAGAPRAVAEPRKAAPDDRPIIAGELKDDAEIAKAIREHYTKYEYRIPMRDGAMLFTVAYVPKDASRTYPMLMTRTPYSVQPYGIDNYPGGQSIRALRRFAPSTRFVREGYIMVHQDVRGRLMSEGTFVDVRPHAAKKGDIDESTDTYDTVDWLVKNVPQNNGKLGLWGVSYPGFYAAQGAVDAHPAVKAVSPQAPVTEWFMGDDFHHNGAFFVADALDFYVNFGKPRPKPTPKSSWDFDHEVADVYDFFLGLGTLADASAKYMKDIPFWNDLVQHGSYDAFWKARDPRPFYKNPKPAVMTVGGWFDSEDLFGALETYRAFETQSKGAQNTLVMGPWSHGGWARWDGDRLGDVQFGQKTSLFYREKIEFPFFDHYLRGKPAPPLPEAYVFETGTNVWRTFDAWPPKGVKKTPLFFLADGKLGAAPPPAAAGAGEDGDSYVSDPKKPVPYRAKHSDRIDSDYMTEDQRFASRRTDVLTYATPPLTADVTLGGPIEANLWVSTTGTDADFVVKLIDVYPENFADPEPNPTGVRMGGYQQLVRGEVMRGKFRKSFEKPEAFKPGEPTLVHFTLPDTCHAFRAGHRIMVQVQSSWFPLVDRNPQTFVDIYHAIAADFRAATHRVYHAPDKASSLTLSVLSGKL